MDLTTGLLKSNEAIGNINPVGAYQSGYKNQLEMNKAEIENEKTRYAQDLQYKLQAAISESINPATGQPDYIKLTEVGQKYGIDAQTLEFARKNLESNWSTYQKVSESKQAVRQMSPEGYETLQGSAKTPWQDKPVIRPTMEQPSTLAPAVPKYTTATTSVSGIDGTQGSSIDTGFGFDTKTDTDNTGFKERAEALDRATQADKTNQYQIASQMETPIYGTTSTSGIGDGSSVKSSTIINYTVPTNTETVWDDATKTYINKPISDERLRANPSLDINTGATNFFRSKTGDYKTQDVNEVAKTYLSTVYDNALKTEGVPFPPARPIRPTPESIDKYNSAMVEWKNKNAQAIGKAEKAVQDVKDAVSKGQFDYADKLTKAQELQIKVGEGDKSKLYKAYNQKARDNVMFMEALKPIADDLKHQLAKVKDGDYNGIQMLLPLYARVQAGRMNPGSQISEGNILESKMGAVNEAGKNAGLNVEGLVAVAMEAANRFSKGEDVNILSLIKEYLTGAIESSSSGNIKAKMLEGIAASDKTAKSYYTTGLVGYEEPETKKGPEAKDESQYTPKTGWFSMPVGTRFKVDPDDTKSQTGMITEVKTNDVTGESKASKVKLEDGTEYSVNDEGEDDEVTLEPWNKVKPNAPTTPKKKKTGGKKTSSDTRKPGESYADYLRRTKK